MANLPNILTLSRIGAIPILVVLFYIESETGRILTLVVFVLAAATDFFDGYVARARKLQSRFGRFLDPVADKLLVGSVIFLLVAFDRVTGLMIIPALIILCREILVSGLREFLAEVKVGMPVSSLAKWKTTIQMFALGFLIIGDASPGWIPSEAIGAIGLWAAALLTLVTGYDYLHAGLQHLTADSPAQGKDATPARVAAEPAKPAE